MTSDPIAVLFVLQTQDKGYPDNRVTSDPIAVLLENGGGEEEKDEDGEESEEKSYNLQQTLGNTFWHGFHCLLASGGRPAHRAKVALNTESPKKTNDVADAEFRKIHQKIVFGAILTEEYQKNHEKTMKFAP